jgi:hypothetical protein
MNYDHPWWFWRWVRLNYEWQCLVAWFHGQDYAEAKEEIAEETILVLWKYLGKPPPAPAPKEK